MYKYIIHFFIIINLFVNFSAYSNDDNCLKHSDYVSEEFAKKIKSDLSLEKASYGLKFIFAAVLQKENNLEIGLSTFHDSVILYILPDCHTILNVEKYPSNYVFELIDNDRFKIHTANQDLFFKHVGNNSFDWLATQIFSGKWSEQSGKEFIFYQNGKVSINSQIANYTIGRQVHGGRIGIVVDIIKISNSNYAFKISNNTLFLYEAFLADISEEPKYILKLITKYH